MDEFATNLVVERVPGRLSSNKIASATRRRAAQMPASTSARDLEVALCEKCSFSFRYAVDGPTP